MGIVHGQLITERSMAGVLSRGASAPASDRLCGSTHRQLSAALQRRVGSLRDARVLDRLGRIGGWYVIGVGTRPPVREAAAA